MYFLLKSCLLIRFTSIVLFDVTQSSQARLGHCLKVYRAPNAQVRHFIFGNVLPGVLISP